MKDERFIHPPSWMRDAKPVEVRKPSWMEQRIQVTCHVVPEAVTPPARQLARKAGTEVSTAVVVVQAPSANEAFTTRANASYQRHDLSPAKTRILEAVERGCYLSVRA